HGKRREDIARTQSTQALYSVSASAVGKRATGEAEELARIKKDYADALALSSTARDEVLAFARVLRKQPAMAIDFTLETPQTCFTTGPIRFTSPPHLPQSTCTRRSASWRRVSM